MVFAIKSNEVQENPLREKHIYSSLKRELHKLNCPVIAINGMSDHVHLLFKNQEELLLDQIAKQIKTVSSLQTNVNWEKGYASFSIGERQVDIVTNYILTQKERHTKIKELESDYWKRIVLKAG